MMRISEWKQTRFLNPSELLVRAPKWSMKPIFARKEATCTPESLATLRN